MCYKTPHLTNLAFSLAWIQSAQNIQALVCERPGFPDPGASAHVDAEYVLFRASCED